MKRLVCTLFKITALLVLAYVLSRSGERVAVSIDKLTSTVKSEGYGK